jgi:hypothetical protein
MPGCPRIAINMLPTPACAGFFFPVQPFDCQNGSASRLKRPRRRQSVRYPNKPKYLDRSATSEQLENAAVNATYRPSPYHCPSAGGRPPQRRAKPASYCPENWTINRARICLREAIRARQVSRQWVGDFPRHVWHKEIDVWYEACTNQGTPGTYHAYPIEISGLPPGLGR